MLLSACLVLAIGVSVFGTIAYLTSTTATLSNTFTIGKVSIAVDEAQVNPDGTPVYPDGTTIDPETGRPVDPSGNPVEPERDDEGNEYRLVPGKTYLKDPTMTVRANSEAAFLRMVVTFNKAAEIKAAGIKLTDMINYDALTSPWTLVNPDGMAEGVNDLVFEFRYKETVETITTAADKRLEPAFTEFRVPGLMSTAALESLEGLTVDVVGNAIQAEGFNGDANAAWAGFDEQVRLDAMPTATPVIP